MDIRFYHSTVNTRRLGRGIGTRPCSSAGCGHLLTVTLELWGLAGNLRKQRTRRIRRVLCDAIPCLPLPWCCCSGRAGASLAPHRRQELTQAASQRALALWAVMPSKPLSQRVQAGKILQHTVQKARVAEVSQAADLK